ncbi:hypothetical protein ACLQ2D_02010 [Streptomyces sp. DT199]|uniref:hypothetical protein n=1 Tax=Streptomyces sp. DT199 TaxID=3393421 RepID=UPI003CF4746F
MRQSLSTRGRVPGHGGHGLWVVVLLAVLALLHATFSPGPTHIAVLDLDGCLRQRAQVVMSETCPAAPVTALTDGAGGHHEGDSAQSCDASAYGSRQLADVSHHFAASGDASGGEEELPACTVRADAACLTPPRPPSGSPILRC